MNEREINPWDMLPADYAGVALTLTGIGFAWASAVQQDAWLMIVAAAIASVGGVLKVRSTRYKGRLYRERQARSGGVPGGGASDADVRPGPAEEGRTHRRPAP